MRWAAAIVSLLIAGTAIATGGWPWVTWACVVLLIGFAVSRVVPFVMQGRAGAIEHLHSIEPSRASGLTALLEIRRSDGFRGDRNRSYVVAVDKTPAASISAGETIRLDVLPGEHVVRCHIDWCGSRAIAVHVAQRGQVALICRPQPMPVALLCLLFRPGRYLRFSAAKANMSKPM